MTADQETADHLNRIANQVDRIVERVRWLDLVLANLDEAFARVKRVLADEDESDTAGTPGTKEVN